MTGTSGVRNVARKTNAYLNSIVVTKIKHLLGTIVLLFVMFGLITWQVRSLTEAAHDSDRRDAALVAYQTQIDLYASDVRARENCLTAVTTREVLRARFEGILSTLDRYTDIIDLGASPEHDPLIVDLHETVATERTNLADDLKVLDPDKCPPMPKRPEFNPDLKLEELETTLNDSD